MVENILPALHPLLTDVEYARINDGASNVSKVDELIMILRRRTGTLTRFVMFWSRTDIDTGRRSYRMKVNYLVR